VRRLLTQRNAIGKGLRPVDVPPKKPWVTSDGPVNAFKKESQRQKTLIRKAKICDAHLTFITTAFRQLANDEDFTNLLRAERLDTMPTFLADKIGMERSVA
jgi:ParB family chromosome partitioning protein